MGVESPPGQQVYSPRAETESDRLKEEQNQRTGEDRIEGEQRESDKPPVIIEDCRLPYPAGSEEFPMDPIPESLVDDGQIHIMEGKGAVLTVSGNGKDNRVNYDQNNYKDRKYTSTI